MEVSKITTKSGREGHDLNDVVRSILREQMDRHGWSETRAAKVVGVSQRTLNRFMKGEHGMNLSSLALLQSSGLYDPEGRAKLRYTKDALYDRFRTILDNAEAADVLSVLEEAKSLGVAPSALAAARSAVEAAKAGRRKGIQQARGSVPRAPSRNRAG